VLDVGSFVPILIRELFLPYPLLVILLAVLLGWAWWRRRRSKNIDGLSHPFQRSWLIGFSGLVALLWISSTPLVAYVSLGSLEWGYQPLENWPADCDTMVVLSGGVNSGFDPADDEVELSEDTLYRCLEAAKLFRQHRPSRVVLTGGKAKEHVGPTLAEAMHDFLVGQGIPTHRIELETASRNTFENALFVDRLLESTGRTHVVLVTDAAHMARSRRTFERLGLKVTVAPCRFRSAEFPARCLIPSPWSAAAVAEASHEWLGLAWYRLRGRL
jgi:uncharacterized SAM-binding protein YcdF (DUF218 family)